MNLDSAVFYTNDISKVVEFYENTIRLKLEYRQGDMYVSFLFDNGVRLGIKKAVEEREKPGAQTVFIGVDHAELAYKAFQEAGVELPKPVNYLEGYGRYFDIYDPDRNKIQFIQRESA